MNSNMRIGGPLLGVLLLVAATAPTPANAAAEVQKFNVGSFVAENDSFEAEANIAALNVCSFPGDFYSLEAPFQVDDTRPLTPGGTRTYLFTLSVTEFGYPVGSSSKVVTYAETPYSQSSASDAPPAVLLAGSSGHHTYVVDLKGEFWDGPQVASPDRVVNKQTVVVALCTGSDPCLDDPVQCVADVPDALFDTCSPFNQVSHANGASAGIPSSSDLYAKFVQMVQYPGPEVVPGLPVNLVPEYDIYVSWHLAPVSAGMTVPTKGYIISEAIWQANLLNFGNPTQQVSRGAFEDVSMDMTCMYLGTVYGNEFHWDVDGGDYGWETSSTCTWEVHADFTLSTTYNVEVSLKDAGVSGGVTTTLAFGGSYGCTDLTRFQSESTIRTLHQPVAIPITKGLAGL